MTTIVRGYFTCTIGFNGKMEKQTYYAVKPDGKILFADTPYGQKEFGPKNPNDWGQSSSLPKNASYIGEFKI